MKRCEAILKKAKLEKYAIPQFNINNLEWTKYILEICEEEKSPVFLGVSPGAAKYMGGYNTVVGLINGLKKDLNITIPIIIHLDHAKSFEDCEKAYTAGFDSLMIDSSLEDIEKNIVTTNSVTKMAFDALIEAELGIIGGVEDDLSKEEMYTTIEDATYFCENTNIDMLAPSLGSVHGIYKAQPDIDFELMQSIASSTGKPLVLHGGSGLSREIIERAITCGICKINFNTEFQVAWNNAVREFLNSDLKVYDPRKIISSGETSIKAAAKTFIEILGSKNKGVNNEKNVY